MKLRFVFDGDLATRLDSALSQEVQRLKPKDPLSRSQIKLHIEQGSTCVNSEVITKAGFLLKAGDLVEFEVVLASPDYLDPYAFELDVLYEDSDLIVINKPAGLTMHPGAGNKRETLVNALVARYDAYPDAPVIFKSSCTEGAAENASNRPGVVHRLDKETTGVVVVAKNITAHADLSKQFSSRSVTRAYQALVLTTPRSKRAVNIEDSGSITGAIGRHSTKRTLMSVVDSGGKQAKTEWKVLDRMAYGVLLELHLKTGRTHQIRVHLDHIGSPVIGDTAYGDFSSLPHVLSLAHKKFGRQALHAYLLGFKHPSSGEYLEFSAPMPEDMLRLIEAFRGYKG